jgi:hypothetical protein
MAITLAKPTPAELTETAVRYALEVDKALLAASDISVLVDKLETARTAAMAAGASFADIYRQADERLIQEIQARWTPGYVPTLAVDGDLDHPVNALGDVVDLTAVAA